MALFYRSEHDVVVGGVLAGFAETWALPSLWVRVGFALGTILVFIVPGILLYLVLLLVIPPRRHP